MKRDRYGGTITQDAFRGKNRRAAKNLDDIRGKNLDENTQRSAASIFATDKDSEGDTKITRMKRSGDSIAGQPGNKRKNDGTSSPFQGGELVWNDTERLSRIMHLYLHPSLPLSLHLRSHLCSQNESASHTMIMYAHAYGKTLSAISHSLPSICCALPPTGGSEL